MVSRACASVRRTSKLQLKILNSQIVALAQRRRFDPRVLETTGKFLHRFWVAMDQESHGGFACLHEAGRSVAVEVSSVGMRGYPISKVNASNGWRTFTARPRRPTRRGSKLRLQDPQTDEVPALVIGRETPSC